MTAPRIRPKVVCVFRRGGDILVGMGIDEANGEPFYGPPGGGIEFGERSEDTLRREMREELGAELDGVRRLDVLEHIFTYQREIFHEIVFVYEAKLRDPALYEADETVGDENGQPYVVRWMPLAGFAPGGPPFYPDGLWEMLAAPLR